MTANRERIAAGRLASYLSPITWADVDTLIMDLGMNRDEIAAAANYLGRNGVRIFDSPRLGLQASPATWEKCQRFAAKDH